MVSTADIRVDYLQPAPLEDLICEASVAHKSPSSKLIRTDLIVWNKSKTTKIAIGRALCNVNISNVDVSALLETIMSKSTD